MKSYPADSSPGYAGIRFSTGGCGGHRELPANIGRLGMTRYLLLAMAMLVTPVQAEDALLAHGKALAEKNCTTCHAIGITGNSALREAPPFRYIAANYDVSKLEDALNEGVATEHPAMPDW
jgi:cytochrome c